MKLIIMMTLLALVNLSYQVCNFKSMLLFGDVSAALLFFFQQTLII